MSVVRRAALAASLIVLGFSAQGLFAPVEARAGRPTQQQTVDWPHFRFDDNHSGVQPFEKTLSKKNIRTAGLLWESQLGDIVDFSSPAVVGGIVYVGGVDGTLWAYSADGCGSDICVTPLWQSTSLAQILDSPTVANGIVFVGSQTDSDNNDGKLNAFAASGCGQAVCAPLWQGDAGPDSILESSPTVADGVVYVGAFDGKLYAFAANGCGKPLCAPLWTGSTGGSIESTPLASKGMVFVGSDDGNLYAFKAKGCGKSSCKAKWSGPLGGAPFQSSPALDDGKIFIAQQHAILAFAADGCGARVCQPLWQGVDTLNFYNGSPAVWRGRVFIPLESGIAIYDENGCGQSVCDKVASLFGSGAQASILSAPTIANGVIYAGRNTGELLAWDASCRKQQCDELWKSQLTQPDPIMSSSPTVVNGRIYIGGARNSGQDNTAGRIYVFGLPQ